MSLVESLPTETLLSILDALLLLDNDQPPQCPKRLKGRGLVELSLSSKRMNGVCSDVLFKTYHLNLDSDLEDTSPGSLQHALYVSHHIRELILHNRPDWAQGAKNPSPYDGTVLSRLITLLRCLPRVSVVRICGEEIRGLSTDVWNALLSLPRLRELDISSDVSIPDDITVHAYPESLSLFLHTECGSAERLLRYVHPMRLYLNMVYAPTKFIPTDPSIQHISVTYRIPSSAPHAPLLDFTHVPQASIDVQFRFPLELRMYIHQNVQRAWLQARPILPSLIADIETYDVTRKRGSACIHVRRPSLIDEPEFIDKEKSAAWVPDDEQDAKEEAEVMKAFLGNPWIMPRWLWD